MFLFFSKTKESSWDLKQIILATLRAVLKRWFCEHSSGTLHDSWWFRTLPKKGWHEGYHILDIVSWTRRSSDRIYDLHHLDTTHRYNAKRSLRRTGCRGVHVENVLILNHGLSPLYFVESSRDFFHQQSSTGVNHLLHSLTLVRVWTQ